MAGLIIAVALVVGFALLAVGLLFWLTRHEQHPQRRIAKMMILLSLGGAIAIGMQGLMYGEVKFNTFMIVMFIIITTNCVQMLGRGG
ncbi:hypothetical protein [Paenibacillus guangzhouensis]|uniref:hypothetical protein n=1 Tax=Paenibacillus guangzhouensis TaxID=1473112 RepID=UPI0012676318|nr:hypothetical protein [Paenibacillus guangzhouensis]